jgi:uncharacterized protein (DUF433 family)
MNWQDHITQNQVTGTQISVAEVLAWLNQGMSLDNILQDVDGLNRADILACILYQSEIK